MSTTIWTEISHPRRRNKPVTLGPQLRRHSPVSRYRYSQVPISPFNNGTCHSPHHSFRSAYPGPISPTRRVSFIKRAVQKNLQTTRTVRKSHPPLPTTPNSIYPSQQKCVGSPSLDLSSPPSSCPPLSVLP